MNYDTSPAESHLAQYNKEYHWEVTLSNFAVNAHT